VTRIKQFARPLGWVVDLDLQGRDVQIVAEFLHSLPHPKRHASWPYGAIAVWAELNLDWFATVDVPERNLVLLDIRAARQRVLPPLIERCAALAGYVSLVGVALVARRTRNAATDAALRRLTRDSRVIERLGL
jgi:hypothetical protein